MRADKLLCAALSALTAFSVFLCSFSAYADYIPDPVVNTGNEKIRFQTNAEHNEAIVTVWQGSTMREYRLNSSGSGTSRCINTGRYYVAAEIEDGAKLPDGVYIIGKAPMFRDSDAVCLSTISPDEDKEYIMTLDTAKKIAFELDGIDGVSLIGVYTSGAPNSCMTDINNYSVSGDYKYNEADFAGLVKKGYTVTADSKYGLYLTVQPEDFYNLRESEKMRAVYRTMQDVIRTKLPGDAFIYPVITSTLLDGYERVNIDDIEATGYFVSGDISSNGIIDLYDAIEIARSLAGARKFSREETAAADFNWDGKADIYDAIGIAGFIIK